MRILIYTLANAKNHYEVHRKRTTQMPIKFRPTAVAGLAVAALATAGLVAVAAPANAAGVTPGWQTPGNTDPNEVGSISLFDASGNQILGGSINDTPIAAYAVGSTAPRAGDTTATLYAFTPKAGVAPGSFGGDPLSSSTSYPVAGAPASISTTLPVVSGTSDDNSLAGYIAGRQNTDTSTTDGYGNLYELRLRTNKSQASSPAAYDAVDIEVTGSTWQVVYPAPSVTATTTLLTASPASASQGDAVTLTATVSPSVSGTVQFKDGTTALGAPVALVGSVATLPTSFATVGNHALSAVFTPAANAAVGASTGTLSFNIAHSAAVATTTGLAISGPTAAYSADTLSATVTPSSAAGSVQFLDGSSVLGSAVVSAGSATLAYNLFGQGSHSLTAVFTPADAASFTGSTSPAVPYTADAPAGAAPALSDVKAEVAAGSLSISSPYTVTNPIDLGQLALDSTDTYLEASKPFGTSTDPIQVTDTRAGNLPWTATVQSTDFSSSTGSINGENLGLTALTPVATAGNALPGAAGNVKTFDNAAALGVSTTDTGSLGLKGSPHTFATATNGTGTIGFTGTLSLVAPSNTAAGNYIAHLTFTVG
ncbi:Ig-like domain (group 3) [Frankineae bacterium MT45]|nr:Ig-like domain (group 3) [Frankineae bacterium MT45]